jgi:hypothetical protein
LVVVVSVIAPFAVNAVNVPAAGDVEPMTILLILPANVQCAKVKVPEAPI